MWGTGLDAHRMVETLPDFWPGQNCLGKILKKIRGDMLEDICLSQIDNRTEGKWKNISPLLNASKRYNLE